MEDKQPAKLSKQLLEMKFMKKTKERVQKEQEDAEGQAMYSKEITEKMREKGHINFVEASIFSCKELTEGRLSFGGMNQELEKMMQNEYLRKVDEVEAKKETDLTDVQMAEGYSTLVNTMKNKFNKKKNKGGARKFLKPSD